MMSKKQHAKRITPVKQATFAPELTLLIERAPYRTNDVVIEHLPSGMERKARVIVCYWDENMGARGEWSVYLKFYPLVQNKHGAWKQDMKQVMFTWTSLLSLEMAS
jgi:hypothetical protein